MSLAHNLYTKPVVKKVNYSMVIKKVLVSFYSHAVTLAASRSLPIAAEGTSVRSAALCRNSEIEIQNGYLKAPVSTAKKEARK
jgi:hypothetical protein